jgi:hypothetical protein
MVTLNTFLIAGAMLCFWLLMRDINKVFGAVGKAVKELDERLEAVEQKNK